GSGAGSGGSLGGGSLGGASSTGGSVGGGTTTGSGGTTAGGGTTSSGTTTGGGGAPPGVTATSVNIGLAYVTNSGSANAALGAGSQDQGDARRSYKVMLKIVNAQGGLDGHRIIPIWHHYDNSSTETVDQARQEACADYFQDHKVFSIDDSGPVLDECAKKA